MLTSNSIIGSPYPLVDWLDVLPSTVTSPEIRPMGRMIAAIAERSSSVKVCAYPARAIVASKFAPAITVWAGSNGFVLPLSDSKISGTAFPPDSDFQ